MKDRKRRFETFSFYDRTGIEAHLKKMAEKADNYAYANLF